VTNKFDVEQLASKVKIMENREAALKRITENDVYADVKYLLGNNGMLEK